MDQNTRFLVLVAYAQINAMLAFLAMLAVYTWSETSSLSYAFKKIERILLKHIFPLKRKVGTFDKILKK